MQAPPVPGSLAVRLDRDLLSSVLSSPLRLLFSFECVFAAFVFAGTYKQNPSFAWLFPFDATFLFFFLSGAYGLTIFFKEGIYRPGILPIAVYLLLSSWVILSTFWTEASDFDRVLYHITRIALLNAWVVIGVCGIISSSRVRVVRFLCCVIFLAVALGLDYVINAGSFSHRGFLADRNYQNTARVVSYGLIISFGFMIFTRFTSVRWYLLALLSGFFFYALLIVGGRLPLISSVIMMFFMFALQLNVTLSGLLVRKGSLPAIVIALGIVILLVSMILAGTENWTLQRLESLFAFFSGNTERDTSASTRYSYIIHAIQFWTSSLKTFLIGNGVLSYSYLYSGEFVEGTNPHNVPLEIVAEFGVVGLFLFLFFLVSILRVKPFVAKTEGALPVVLMGLFGAVGLYILTSADMLSLYLFLIFFTLLLVLDRKPLSRGEVHSEHQV